MDIKFAKTSDFFIDINKVSVPYDMAYMHHHNSYEIYLLLDGKRNIIIDDKVLCGVPGDIYLIPPGRIHRTCGGGHERIVVNFSEEFIERCFNDEFKRKILECFDAQHIRARKDEFKLLCDICRLLMRSEKEKSGEMAAIKLGELLLILDRNRKGEIEKKEASGTAQLVSDILLFIDRNYIWLDDIGEIAEKFLISREYLCRIFKKHTGNTVVSYINELKLKTAQQLILKTNKKITEISLECGYSSAAYFSRLFAEKYGISPKEYRGNARTKSIDVSGEEILTPPDADEKTIRKSFL